MALPAGSEIASIREQLRREEAHVAALRTAALRQQQSLRSPSSPSTATLQPPSTFAQPGPGPGPGLSPGLGPSPGPGLGPGPPPLTAVTIPPSAPRVITAATISPNQIPATVSPLPPSPQPQQSTSLPLTMSMPLPTETMPAAMTTSAAAFPPPPVEQSISPSMPMPMPVSTSMPMPMPMTMAMPGPPPQQQSLPLPVAMAMPTASPGPMSTTPPQPLQPVASEAAPPHYEGGMPVGPSFRDMLAALDGRPDHSRSGGNSGVALGGRFPGGERGPLALERPDPVELRYRDGQEDEEPWEEDPDLLPERTVQAPGGARLVKTYGPDGMPASEDLGAGEDPNPRHRAFAEHRRQQYLRGELEEFEILDPGSVFPAPGARAVASVELYFTVHSPGRRLPRDTVGLAYRFSKSLEDVDPSAVAPWGAVVAGVDEEDGWVRVGGRYLPMSIEDTQVLSLRDAKEYVVDNKELQSDAPGVAYRLSRNVEDRDPRDGPLGGPPFGSIITGVDLGDGWVKVGSRFLPMEVSGFRVLFERGAERRICAECGSILKDDSVFCRKCGTRASTAIREGEESDARALGGSSQMQQELDDLYRELHRRMLQEADPHGIAAPLPLPVSNPNLPPVTTGLLDFPIAQHNPSWGGRDPPPRPASVPGLDVKL